MAECSEFKPIQVLDLRPITILQREAGRDAAAIYLQKVIPLSFRSKLRLQITKAVYLGGPKRLLSPPIDAWVRFCHA